MNRHPSACILTLPAFLGWLQRRGISVREAEVEPCACGDMNCHGWRVVAKVIDHGDGVTAFDAVDGQ